ncbi:MAG: dTDP-glucose 4,6-dehydratase, partial [Verrucomicrobia bacterium]|nr:dTDP-glucose 4,6-dehydratase [Verrucomicrobiota bacterium]
RPGHDFKYTLNSDKIKNTINWECKYNFDKGLEETILWYIDKFSNNFFRNENFAKRQGLNK